MKYIFTFDVTWGTKFSFHLHYDIMRKEYIHLLLNINDTMIVFVIAVYVLHF